MNLIKKQHNFLPLVFDNFFRDTWDIMPAIRNNSPATNIKESDKDFIIEFAIPGKSNNDFEIELDNQLLTVKTIDNISKNAHCDLMWDDMIRKSETISKIEDLIL